MSSSEIQGKLAAIWADALGVETVAAEQDFFELGGDSVLVTIISLQVEELFDIVVDPALVFEHPTLGAFAAAVETLATQPA
ncbi:phosphopantetheine-binding protein [Caulobacter endophyticus]|uniref:phosphopantetheine-binding protein n=1 Tax=Caulobacter endophyticus TaxID=2172652 RepID=UPI002410639D|nr:phosphopantetheine-binding protein [Caulobacter endophyticus]MDG2528908.1 phosphopantetheine-binding protein [Caulobacter endophyticus]